MQHRDSKAQTVFLVDDDESIRSALTRALQVEGFQVRAWATADAFLAEYDRNEPGCLLTDVQMPGTNGLQLQAEVAARGLKLPVVFISESSDVRTSVQAMRSGAVTFLTKPVRMSELTPALQEAMEADRESRDRNESLASIRRRLAALTPREREVFDLVVIGRMNKQISAQLGMAEKTTKVHRGRVMRKMNARSVVELVTIATQLGMLGIPSQATSQVQAEWAGVMAPKRLLHGVTAYSSASKPGVRGGEVSIGSRTAKQVWALRINRGLEL